MMERHQRAQFAFRISVEQDFERAVGAVARATSGSILDIGNKLWIYREAGSCQVEPGKSRRGSPARGKACPQPPRMPRA